MRTYRPGCCTARRYETRESGPAIEVWFREEDPTTVGGSCGRRERYLRRRHEEEEKNATPVIIMPMSMSRRLKTKISVRCASSRRRHHAQADANVRWIASYVCVCPVADPPDRYPAARADSEMRSPTARAIQKNTCKRPPMALR